MKEKLSDEFRDILLQIKAWLNNETRLIKLTVSEKLSIFMGTLLLAAAMFTLIMIGLVIISLCLISVFEPLVGLTLAYLCVGGIFVLLAILLLVLRKQVIYNPIAKMVSKLLLENDEN